MKIQRKRLCSDDDIEIFNKNKKIYYDNDINDDYYDNDINNVDNVDIKCTSDTCTHSKSEKIIIKKIDNLKDLINLAEKYNCVTNKEYNGINLRILNNLINPLKELDKMIGLNDIKNKVISQVLYFCRGYNSNPCGLCIDCHLKIPCCATSKEMLHTVITGSPGVGKTEFARILAKIYARCGFVKNDELIEVTRKDLISGYLGRTAKKTMKIFKKAKNRIIFIDEAYSLGNNGNEDTYSKECIDIINKQLSENKDIILIIAGYEKEIEECFFKINPGLKRRFPFKYNINGYTGAELFEILDYKIKRDSWTLDKNDYEKVKKYIITHHKNFINYGGDMETLLMKAKINNARNINAKNFCLKYEDFIPSLTDKI
jgi:hypothetical protein